jgi:ATP-dependent Clp protease ATP-binding subunit ClpC
MQQFTDKAKAALQKAARAAKDLQQSYIGSEHILLGLIKERGSVASRVLVESGVSEEQLVSMIRELIAPEGGLAIMERDGYSPRAQRILDEYCSKIQQPDDGNRAYSHFYDF